MWKLYDGNALDEYDNWSSLIRAAESWFDYILDDEEWPQVFPTADYSDISEGDIKALQTAIDAFLAILAEAKGHKAWAGHGNYYVSAASEAGLRLDVGEVA